MKKALVAVVLALLACKGDTGDPGPLGPQGAQGTTGQNGACFGVAPGNVAVSTRVYPTPGYTGSDCHTGWNFQLFSIEAEEVR
ncbi:MAG TPA: hypothetical protein VFA20_14210 [Myxococcaceae bacterium]|nr:hypothetical protein [Myxococcaceae bacterium]